MITIKGTQFADNEQDSVELTTVGRLYRRGEAYYICYNESEATGFDGAKTTLKVEGTVGLPCGAPGKTCALS